MMTLMPVAAFAAPDAGTTYIYTVKDNPTVNLKEDQTAVDGLTTYATADVTVDFRNASNIADSTTALYVWVTESGSSAPSSALGAVSDATKATDLGAANNNVFVFDDTDTTLYFIRDGVYTIHAAFADQNVNTSDKTASEVVSDLTQIATTNTNKTITVKSASTSSSKYVFKGLSEELKDSTASDGKYFAEVVQLEANNVAEKTLKFTLYENSDLKNVVKGQTVKIDTNSSSLELSKSSATTNALGQFSFDVSASIEGSYEIYLTAGSCEVTVKVQVGATGPAYISVVKSPTAPIDVDAEDLSNIVRFGITDINGNSLYIDDIKANDMHALESYEDEYKNYVAIVSQPSASDLESEDVKLIADTTKKATVNGVTKYPYATLEFAQPLSAEGTYTFKVVLNNGNYVTVTLEVKEFQTPVSIELTYSAPSVELGGTLYVDKLNFIDANGVTKSAKGSVELAATGYAIQSFNTTTGAIVAKSDEKYLGSEIVVTAVSERYNLTANATVKVVDEAAELTFSTKTGEVNVNNAITVMLVDSEGNRVALGENYDVDSISYVILDKPEDAKVTATTASIDNNLATAGSFKMNLTSNKVGNVAVQVIAKVTNRQTADTSNVGVTTVYINKEGVIVPASEAFDEKGNLKDGYTKQYVASSYGTDNTQQYVTKYYTGTQIFAIGTGSAGDVVVMSIGSHEIIVNDAKSTIDAAPMIQNDRTYVPFRALAEAFGAEVAYDEATQAVTAELNGVTVVMTIGSATYTVNGTEKTMDVAPFISGSRTMIPVRFAAEAFGIKVIPTYDQNGATADILFNL